MTEITKTKTDDYDFYAVQKAIGFSKETYTVACFSTYDEAKQYVENHKGTIIGQYWGKYNNYYD